MKLLFYKFHIEVINNVSPNKPNSPNPRIVQTIEKITVNCDLASIKPINPKMIPQMAELSHRTSVHNALVNFKEKNR